MSPQAPFFPPAERHLFHATELLQWVRGQLAKGHSCLAFICGAPGSGKSHLALEASSELGPSARVISEDLHYEEYDALPPTASREAWEGAKSIAVIFDAPDLRSVASYVAEAAQAGVGPNHIAWFVLDGGLPEAQEVQRLRQRLPLALGPSKPELTEADLLTAVRGVRQLFRSAPTATNPWGIGTLGGSAGAPLPHQPQPQAGPTVATPPQAAQASLYSLKAAQSTTRVGPQPASISQPNGLLSYPSITGGPSFAVLPCAMANPAVSPWGPTKLESAQMNMFHPTVPAGRRSPSEGSGPTPGLLGGTPLSVLLAQFNNGPSTPTAGSLPATRIAVGPPPLPLVVVAPPGGPMKAMGQTLGSVLNGYVRAAKPLPIPPAQSLVRY